MNVKSAGQGSTSIWFWLVVPVVMLMAQILVEIFVPEQYKAPLNTEGSPLEDIEFLVLLPAIVIAAMLLPRIQGTWMKIWVALALAGCIYIAGEEESWGQHIFGWSTPDYWAHVNDQDETNLHNTSSWLDQKPRALMFIGIVVGGLIIPALRQWRPSWLPAKFERIYPTDTAVPVSALVLLTYTVDHLWHKILGYHLFFRVSEVQEFYIYYFLLVYLAELRKREIS